VIRRKHNKTGKILTLKQQATEEMRLPTCSKHEKAGKNATSKKEKKRLENFSERQKEGD